jgi:YVTN family beta-propeller protein
MPSFRLNQLLGTGGHLSFRPFAFGLGASLLVLTLALVQTLVPRAQAGPAPAGVPGAQADGSTLLPNGWRLAAVGRHLAVSDLPLNVVQSLDSRYLVVLNNGIAKPSMTVIDVANWAVKSTVPLDNSWFGLAWHPSGNALYVGGGAQNNVQEFSFADGVLTRARTFALPAATGQTFAGGLAVARDGKMLYVTRLFAQSLSAIDLTTGQVVKTMSLAAEPYGLALSPDGQRLYVSIWGGGKVQVLDPATLAVIQNLDTGEHPTAMTFSNDGSRLFVACANSAGVWVFATSGGQALEVISTNLFPDQPGSSTPNALSVSPDGKTLLVATADSNTVVVVDISNSVASYVSGFIPTGWYPTAAVFSRDGRQIFVLSGKGLQPAPNMVNAGTEQRLQGAVTVLAVPDRTTLADYTRRVYAVTPYNDAIRLTPNVPVGSPVPRSIGASSPIKYVFYIIRENRTYDQVFGDFKQGNGDPRMVLFGRDVTPNAHAIAEQFVLFDNFYVDADVSYDGHAFSMAAYAPDSIQKIWQTLYGVRGGIYLGEGGGSMRNRYGNLTAPEGGYIWDAAHRSRVTVRSYGEFVDNVSKSPTGDVVAVESVPGLKGYVAPAFAAFDLSITDNKRVDTWLQEFNGYVQNGNLPQLSILRLGNDHTIGSTPGWPTPRAMVAENDLALGRVVEAIANSPYWKTSAVFVLEDDAQNGPDHVDSHRSVALVASPFAKRGFVDHTFYSTSSVLRTIELILGMDPMSQYDGAATPMHAAFQPTPNLTAYSRQTPAVPLDEKNAANAAGAQLSLSMDFSGADRTPEDPLNEVVWRSIKGPDAPMPPPRRSVFAPR